MNQLINTNHTVVKYIVSATLAVTGPRTGKLHSER